MSSIRKITPLIAPIRTIPHDIFRDNNPTLEELEHRPRMPVVALLDNIRSMWNVGAMFRSADGAWIEELILGGYTATPPRQEISKTALGSEYSVPWRHTDHSVMAIKALQKRGYQAVALEHTTRSNSYTDIQYQFPLVFVVGNEGVGVQDEVAAACDLAVEIPQFGMKSSLNVAVAFGVMIYEVRRQWTALQRQMQQA
ncbi:MAG: RNA methyltransferase [Candidatus Marinimicrobia bacterium CG_4_10_14_0_2_um_filter_48_9]|nr:MAG: RNA methyltransferase [Candidatus Marinimicrobia bacterium CG_4_10_14_0_2_um_filter_48_9]PJA54594.1 MAG: RNA methyltransferase [Candidatus Marinimicrobia bacterium CG_4_9_14_3_um_filter_48_9]